MTASFAVAPNFHCDGSWADRLLVVEGNGWRVPDESELAGLTSIAPGGDAVCLFNVPMHMRSRFWTMLDDEATQGTGDFVYFSDDLAEFLTFKDLPPPSGSVCELLLQDAGGTVTTDEVWALVNFGEEPVLVAWPGLQLRLNSGEGIRTAPGLPANVMPPENGELNVLLAIRPASAVDAG